MVERSTSGKSDQAQLSDVDSVDSLMRALAHVPSLEAQELVAPSEASSAEPAQGARLARVGQVLAERYLLTSILGRGGMGAVYAARNLGTGREVAIKVLLPETPGDSMRRERVARFVREARAAGRVRHPNVVDVYDVDSKHGLPYLVMERLYGESLGERLRRGPLPVSEALRVLLEAMSGVAEAHRQGVIHRDLKPDNIFLATVSPETAPVAKVLDFGVSRIVFADQEEAKATTLTRTGHLLGTFEYMPLEQLRGAATVDARADVYALGVILYEAIAGVRPYEEAANERDLCVRLATEDAVPLSARVSGLSPELVSAVARALERDPDKRFPTVESFARELAATCAAPPPVVRQVAVDEPSSKRPRAWRGLLTLTLTLTLVGLLSVWWRPSLRSAFAPVEPSRAQQRPPPPLPAVEPRASPPRPATQLPGAELELEGATRERAAAEPASSKPARVQKPERVSAEGKVKPAAASKLKPARADRPTQLLKSDF